MMRRFVRAVLAAVAAAVVLSSAGAASAQEIQLTGPLKGAPAVRRLRMYRQGRLELSPSVSFTLLDEYERTILVGAILNYSIFDWLAIGAWGGAGVANLDTDLTSQINQKAPRDILTSKNVIPQGNNFDLQTAKISYMVAPQLTFIPFRGKLAIFNKIFVDSDLYLSVGAAFVGVKERGDCGGGGNQPKCTDVGSYNLSSTTKIAPTFGVGFKYYPSDFWSLGVEYRGVPFAWNRAGFDSAGAGPNGNFPDGKIDSKDESFKFNQLVTISVGFYFPFTPKLSD